MPMSSKLDQTHRSQNRRSHTLPKCRCKASSKSPDPPTCATQSRLEKQLKNPVTRITPPAVRQPADSANTGRMRMSPPIMPLTSDSTVSSGDNRLPSIINQQDPPLPSQNRGSERGRGGGEGKRDKFERYLQQLDMAKGKKGKQIEKAEKPAKAARPAPKEESSDHPEDNGDIFSTAFRQRLDQFATLNQEVLTIKAQVEGNDTNGEIAQRRERVSGKIETASAAILKDELNSLEQWIEQQQAQLAEEINKIVKARDDIEATLRSTGAFSAEEIAAKVAKVQARADEKQQVHDDYSALLKKSQQIYS